MYYNINIEGYRYLMVEIDGRVYRLGVTGKSGTCHDHGKMGG